MECKHVLNHLISSYGLYSCVGGQHKHEVHVGHAKVYNSLEIGWIKFSWKLYIPNIKRSLCRIICYYHVKILKELASADVGVC